VVVRPSFILGGSGSGIAHSAEALEAVAAEGLDKSPVSEILIEESLVGWKEFELEVMRDLATTLVHHLLDREPRSDGASTPATRSPSRLRRR